MPKLKRKVENMDAYSQLAKVPIFSISEVEKITGNSHSAYSLMSRLMKKDLVRKIRKNIYTAINPVTGDIVASPFQIACGITETAYISHHSAFEYHGVAHQVFYEVYVSSETKFNSFGYDYWSFKYISSRINEGVIDRSDSIGIRVTELERTVLDSIYDLNKIGGLEELLHCLNGIGFLEEDKLLRYLDLYDNQGLYQRTGFILQHFKEQFSLSQDFFESCKERIGKSRGYLFQDNSLENHYNKEWQLMVPLHLSEMTEQGGSILV